MLGTQVQCVRREEGRGTLPMLQSLSCCQRLQGDCTQRPDGCQDCTVSRRREIA